MIHKVLVVQLQILIRFYEITFDYGVSFTFLHHRLNGHRLSWFLQWSIGLIWLFSVRETTYLLEKIQHHLIKIMIQISANIMLKVLLFQFGHIPSA